MNDMSQVPKKELELINAHNKYPNNTALMIVCSNASRTYVSIVAESASPRDPTQLIVINREGDNPRLHAIVYLTSAHSRLFDEMHLALQNDCPIIGVMVSTRSEPLLRETVDTLVAKSEGL